MRLFCLQTNFEGADLSDVLMDRCGQHALSSDSALADHLLML